MSGRMNSLYFAASFAPRMEQAASQIQDSRDLPFDLCMIISARSPALTPSDFFL
jgi:hypothetical protein